MERPVIMHVDAQPVQLPSREQVSMYVCTHVDDPAHGCRDDVVRVRQDFEAASLTSASSLDKASHDICATPAFDCRTKHNPVPMMTQPN